MATFIGFNTQNSNMVRNPSFKTGVDGGAGSMNRTQYFGKKFRSTDEELVIRDFINALNIPQGSKPGKPSYGTTLWNFVFEPNDLQTQTDLEAEIRRIADQDPRITLNTVVSYTQENGILVEIEFAVSPFNNVQTLEILFDLGTKTALAQ